MTFDLRHGSCLDPVTGMASLPDGSVDHVLMDPPYSERVHRRLGNEGRGDGGKERAALTFGHLTESMAAEVATQVCRVARRWILIFCDELSFGVWVAAIEAAGGEYVRKGTWVKTDAMPQMSGDRPSTGTEEIVIAHAARPNGGRLRWNGGGRRAVYTGPAQERGIRRIHPAQKPLWLVRQLLTDFTDPGESVLDPFAGGGSTLVAAKLAGRLATGWELDGEMADRARARLAGEPDPSPGQLSLLGEARGPA